MRRKPQIRESLKLVFCLTAVLVTVAGLWSCRSETTVEKASAPAPPAFPAIQPSPPPTDIDGGAANATLKQAATFAWQEFIALNWPAKAGVRDTLDSTKKFGDQSGPLVWQTYRHKVEIFPGNGSASIGPPGTQISGGTPSNPPNYGYDNPPVYVYDADVLPCTGQTAPAQPAWVNLDEISQISVDKMFAGIVPSAATPVNSQPQLIRFMAKANRTQYTYVVQNQYWYKGGPVQSAAQNFINTTSSQTQPKPPQSPYVNFPAGTIEIKAAWRPLASNEDPTRFHMTTVRYYEPQGSGSCYREASWALVALHIIQKTPSAPSFIYATFEQADNILLPNLDASGKPVPVEDVDGNIISPVPTPTPTPATPTTPGLSYKDDPTNPQVTANGSFCSNPGAQIFYVNEPNQSGVPTGGNICINRRDNAIPPDIIAINQAAHNAIKSYNSANGITQSPWLYYKLVNVQAYPFDKSKIDTSNPNGVHNPSTFYQANIVVETSFLLQMFSGRIAANGAPTNYPPPTPSPTPPEPKQIVPPNVFVTSGSPAGVTSFNMGGCMGCHGNAQAAGYDFSFILKGGNVHEPEHPTVPNALLVRKYGFAVEKGK